MSARSRWREVALQMRLAVEKSDESIIITDRTGVIKYVNAAFTKTTGYPASEALGRTPRLLKSGRHPPAFFERLWSDLLAGRPFRAVFTNAHRNGSLFFEDKVITPLCGAGGRVTHFVSAGRDVTAGRAVERAFWETSQGMGEAIGADFLAALAMNLGRSLDVECVLIGARKAGAAGVARVAAHWRDGALRAGGDYTLAGTPCERAASGEDLVLTHGVLAEFPDCVLLRDFGAESYAGVPLRPGSGDPIGHLCVMSRRRLPPAQTLLPVLRVFAARAAAELLREELAREARAAAQRQKLESLGRLAAGIAHDFNNALTVIRAGISLAAADLLPGSPAAEDLASVREASERAVELARQILHFSRPGSQKDAPLAVNPVVEAVAGMFRRMAGCAVKLSLELAEGLPPVVFTKGKLDQVLMNLLLNARDASPAGATVTVSTAASGGGAAVIVRDSGVGMDAAARARLFEPFFTTKGEGAGTGLGLATAYALVREAGGDIRVESTPGRGSVFTVAFPAPPPGAVGGFRAESGKS